MENVFHTVAEEIENLSHTTVLYTCSGSWISDIFNIRNINADIYHITGDIYYISLFLPRKKTTLTFHDIGYFKNKKRSFKNLMLALILFIFPAWKMKKMTCVSQLTKMDLINYFRINPRKIIIINDPLSLKLTYIPKVFNEMKPVILQIGTGIHKNLIGLIEAAKDIHCQLMIVGDPSRELIEKMDRYGMEYSIENNLTNDQVIEKYILCDILYFASWSEGFGMPIIEAQAVGRPVITSNMAPMPDVAGKGASFVDPRSPEEIKMALIQIIEQPEYREQLISEGLNNVHKYNPSEIAREYLDFYCSFLS
jgi:glycosyltransferase involved in cell wall biosynthesis